MAQGIVYAQRAMNQLAVLEPGGTPSTSQQALLLQELNAIIGELQAKGALGSTETITVTGRQIVRSVSTAGVWTTTDTGGVETRVATPAVVATFASLSTDNTYPVGWDAYLPLALAVRYAGAAGVGAERVPMIAAMAQAALAEIMPKDVAKPTGQEKA